MERNMSHQITALGLALGSIFALFSHLQMRRIDRMFVERGKTFFGESYTAPTPFVILCRTSGISLLLAIGAVMSWYNLPGMIMLGVSCCYELVLTWIWNRRPVSEEMRAVEASSPVFRLGKQVEPFRIGALILVGGYAFYAAFTY